MERVWPPAGQVQASLPLAGSEVRHELPVVLAAPRDGREALREAPAVQQAFLPGEPEPAAACEQPVVPLASLPDELEAVAECELLAALPAVPQDDLVVRHELPVELAAPPAVPVVVAACERQAERLAVPQVDWAEHRGLLAAMLAVLQAEPEPEPVVACDPQAGLLAVPQGDSGARHGLPVDRAAPQGDCRVLPERHVQAAAQFRALTLLRDYPPVLRDARQPVSRPQSPHALRGRHVAAGPLSAFPHDSTAGLWLHVAADIAV